MNGLFTGTGRLVRLALRRDRIKLPIWLLALGGIFFASAASVTEVYSQESERVGYALASAVSGVARAFNGPVTGTDMGSVALTETFTFFSIFVALMSTMLIIRHTRQNEETGRSELIGAAVVGRFAPLGAALLVAVIANIAFAAIAALAYIAIDLPVEGSLLAGAGLGMIGIIFAGIAALAAQLTQSARAANGIAGASIGLFFLLRAIGDMFGKVQPGGMDVVPAWLTFVSPIGLAREARPFTDNHWWMLAVLAAIFVVFIGLSFWLQSRRDAGAGLFAARQGRPQASQALIAPFGLIWRLQRGLFVGWTAAVAVLALSFGGVASEVEAFTSNSEQIKAVLASLGGSQNVIDAYLAFSITLFAVMAAGYGIQALLRLRQEETAGRAELVLAGAKSRIGWVCSYIFAVSILAGLLLLVAGGLSGVAYGISINDVWQGTAVLSAAAMAYFPAILFFVSISTLCFSLVPSLSIALAWGAFALSYGLLQFGQLLKLPEWSMNLSPFTHIPTLPAETFESAGLLWLSGISLVVILGSLAIFRWRDITTT